MTTVYPYMKGSSSKSANDNQQQAQAAEKPPARLCYVDDSRTSAYVVKRLLRPYGYVVDHFNSAEPALIALVKDKYDLLLTDLKVSPTGMDGDDLVRALRNSGHEKISSLPVIVITGATDESVLKEVYQAGANQILSKPVNGDELDTHIRNLVHGDNSAVGDLIKNSISSPDSSMDSPAGREPHKSKPAQSGDVESPSQALPTNIPTATVVPFEPEAFSNKSQNFPIESDNIPILDTLDAAKSGEESTDHKPAPDDGKKGSGKRRVLNTASAIPQKEKFTPQPIMSVKPASRVKPTINAASNLSKPTTDSNTPANANTASTGEQLTPEQIVARQKLLKAKELAKKRKILAAAAAKKQQSSAQSVTSERNVPRKPKIKPKFDINKIPTDHLSLEPLGNSAAAEITAESFINDTQTQAATGQRQQSKQPEFSRPATAPTASNHSSAAAKTADVNADAGAQSGTADNRGQEQEGSDFKSQFEAEVDAATNILQEMERYPLVETGLSSSYTPSRVVSAVGSILELYGPKKIITAVFLLVAGLFGYNAWTEYFDDGQAVEVVNVQQGEIYQSITVPGKVVSKLRVNLTPAIAGRLTHVYVEEGDTVKSGDLLARLDDREAKSMLKRATASYESAKEDVLLAERSLKRLKQAFEKGAIARRLVEEAEVELRSAKAREAIVEEEVRTAKLSLENPRIVAPFAGTITARFVEVGQWVVPSETLFTLIDEKQREVEVQVDAADSGGIAVGQTVTLSSDAFPNLEWSESVTRLAAATSNVGNANTVSVYISLGNNAPSLRFGQQVDADIRTAWNPNALKLPFGAITNRGGKSYVATIQDGKVHFVEVVTGIEDFSHVEILQGVNVGQSVIMANGIDLQPNQKVFVAANNS